MAAVVVVDMTLKIAVVAVIASAFVVEPVRVAYTVHPLESSQGQHHSKNQRITSVVAVVAVVAAVVSDQVALIVQVGVVLLN